VETSAQALASTASDTLAPAAEAVAAVEPVAAAGSELAEAVAVEPISAGGGLNTFADDVSAAALPTGHTESASGSLVDLSGDVTLSHPDAPVSLSGADGDLLDLSIFADLLSGAETSLVITGLIGLIGHSSASGLGIRDFFVRHVLQPSTPNLRMTFQAVKLVPCPATATASGMVVTGSGSSDGDAFSSHANERRATLGTTAGPPVWGGTWPIPFDSHLLLRVFGGLLAALSALLAGMSGVRHERRERQQRSYRRRLHS